MEKPKILVFIDWYYPGYKAGGPVRSCLNMVQHLKDEFDFFIVTGNTEYTEDIPYKNIEFNSWQKGPNDENVMYLDEEHRNVSFYISLIEEKKYQSVMLMGIFSKFFSIIPLKALHKTGFENIIVSPRGMLAPGALKIKSAKKKIFISWANVTGLYRDVKFHVTNDTEKKQVEKSIWKFKSIVVADNFPRKMPEKVNALHLKKEGTLKLISVARIAPEKNTLYALEVLKNCKSKIVFDIYGSVYDASYWEQCKTIISQMPSNIQINYQGDLPSDKLFDVLPDYDFLFLPTRGENFGHIIFESFMCGVPVIISDKTPWRNLNEQMLGFDFSLIDKNVFTEELDKICNWKMDDILKYKDSVIAYAIKKSDVIDLKNSYRILFNS